MVYHYVVDCDVAETLLRLPIRQREQLIRAFRLPQIRFNQGSPPLKIRARDIQKKRFGRWIISFWTDHPVKEVRIVGLQAHKL